MILAKFDFKGIYSSNEKYVQCRPISLVGPRAIQLFIGELKQVILHNYFIDSVFALPDKLVS